MCALCSPDGNESFLLQALNGLAEVHFRSGDSKKGEEYASKAKELWGVVAEQELKAQGTCQPCVHLLLGIFGS